MTLRLIAAVVLALSVPIHAQKGEGPRSDIEKSLKARFSLTEVGTKFGHWDPDAIRRAGGAVVLRRGGLCGAFSRGQICSNAIRGDQVELLSGRKDMDLVPGQEFYVNSVAVGSDVVAIGLLSVRTFSQGSQSGRLWASANFFFPRDVLSRADANAVYSEIDQWLGPQDSTTPVAGESRPKPAVPVQVQLKPGMSRDEVISALGPPIQEVKFGDRSWLTYSGLVAVLEQNALVSVDRSGGGQPPAKLSVASEPSGADLYIDGSFVGSTPAALPLPPGTHKVSVQSKGYQEWQRDLQALAGAEINLRAQLVPETGK